VIIGMAFSLQVIQPAQDRHEDAARIPAAARQGDIIGQGEQQIDVPYEYSLIGATPIKGDNWLENAHTFHPRTLEN
jgi:hypothetical protein